MHGHRTRGEESAGTNILCSSRGRQKPHGLCPPVPWIKFSAREAKKIQKSYGKPHYFCLQKIIELKLLIGSSAGNYIK